ncbi:hypothetical protein HGRIS_011740 [Hohenbuehelia grisea]|uniref:Uncharacterized protein n=1 Tax=Hohenbuehelia grisea TaxID=104357 RepID=A0ABR3JX39_9AGAR
MVHKSAAIVLGAIALNAASTLAGPIAPAAANEVPDGMVTHSEAKVLNARMAADSQAEALEAREPMLIKPVPRPYKGLPIDPLTPFRLPKPAVHLARDVAGEGQSAELEAREPSDEDNTQDLEARRIGKALGKVAPWAPLIAAGLSFLPGQSQPQRREVEELLGRELEEVEVRSLDTLISTFQQVAPFLPMLAPMGGSSSKPKPSGNMPKPVSKPKREAADEERPQELEARRIGKVLGKVAPWAPLLAAGLSFLPGQSQPQRREELEELLGRDLEDHEARSLDTLVETFQQVAPFLPMLAPTPGGGPAPKPGRPAPGKPPRPVSKPKREVDDELVARGHGDSDSRAPFRSHGRGGSYGATSRSKPKREPLDEDHAQELEARRIGKVLGKVAPWAPLLAAGLSFIPGQSQPQRREEFEELFARELEDAVTGELEARRVKIGKVIDKAAPWAPLLATGLSFVPNPNQRRELEELEARRVKVGKVIDKVAPWAPLLATGLSFVPNPNQRRELEELEARRVKVGKVIDKAAPWAPLLAAGLSFAPNPNQRREVEELETLLGRELTDIEARGFGKAFGKVAPWAPLIATGLSFLQPQSQPASQPQRRDIEDILGREPTELEARDLADVLSGALDGHHDLD